MNKFFKNTVLLLAFVLLSSKAIAQKFTTHKVKKGERLEQVSERYNVSIADILIYNKEVKVGESLNPNSILVIPQDKVAPKAESTPTAVQTTSNTATKQEDPIGFTSHKVKRKETLFGIAKRYNITEDDIKKYNRELYSSQLKKKMVLRIPKFRRTAPSDTKTIASDGDFDTYIVKAKETRWSVAHKYGITVADLEALNPALTKDSTHLAEGQELKVPKIAGSTIKGQETQLYTSYTVPKGVGIFRLTQNLGVTSKEIMDLNPQIAEQGGLKEGMVIRIPEQKQDVGTVNTDNFIFYEVKPKQNEFRLTRKFGMSWKELVQYNPALKQGVKAGMVLKLPKAQAGNFDVRNSLVLDKIDLLDSINPGIRPKVLFILPFRLDRVDIADKSSIEKNIKSSVVNASLGLYSGALIAMDSIADLGISIDIKVLDNARSLAKTKELMTTENLGQYNAVFGPLVSEHVQEVATTAKGYQVPVVVPTKIKASANMSNVFLTYAPEEIQRNNMFAYMDSLAVDKNIIVIADMKNEMVAKMIMQRFPDAKKAEVIEEEKNVSMNIDKFKALLSEEQENWVFVESGNYKLISSVTSILNSSNNTPLDVTKSRTKVKIRMFTTNKNSSFDNDVISVSHLSKLNFTYPSVYKAVPNNSFMKRYEKRFDTKPDRWAVRGFDITYDLLLKLAYNNNLMSVSEVIGETEYNGNKFSYENNGANGYYNQATYIMSYENLRIKRLE